tara:strand:- start:101 stop:349 length:249 start_codon:yes stop_codon:yes gene_type:complete
MAVERDQLATSDTTDKIPNSFIDRHGSVGQLAVNEILSAFKDGVTDAMLHGTRDEKQSHHYYKQGYDFGIDLFCKQEEWTHD